MSNDPDRPDPPPRKGSRGTVPDPKREDVSETTPDPEMAGGDGPSEVQDGTEFRRLHPLSVFYRGLVGSLNLGTLVFFVGVVGSGFDMQSLAFVGLLIGGVLVSVAYQVGYYRRFRYRVAGETLDIESGVVSRRQREIPLGRIQNVDVGQNPVQRALGIASVSVETAGGGSTEAEFKYVSLDEADRLRAALRGRTVEDRDASGTTDARGTPVFTLSTRELLVLSTFTFDRGAGVIASIVATVTSTGAPGQMTAGVVDDALSVVPGDTIQSIVVFATLFMVSAWVLSFVLTFARFYGFRLRRVEDELEYERGLLQRYTGSIPLDKVQTLTVSENLFKRRFGYASLAVETAGYAPGSEASEGSQSAVPLASRDQVLDVARSLEPFEATTVKRPPKRARQRYAVRYGLGVLAVAAVAFAVVGVTDTQVPPRYWAAVPFALAFAFPAAHLKWRHRGYCDAEDHFLTRSGFWRRTTRVVPYFRVQTVVDSRTIFQRRRRLANVTADTAASGGLVGGDPTALDVDAGDADRLRDRLRDRLQVSLRERRLRSRATAGSDGTEVGSVPEGTDDADEFEIRNDEDGTPADHTPGDEGEPG
jgi:putative membrane protein